MVVSNAVFKSRNFLKVLFLFSGKGECLLSIQIFRTTVINLKTVNFLLSIGLFLIFFSCNESKINNFSKKNKSFESLFVLIDSLIFEATHNNLKIFTISRYSGNTFSLSSKGKYIVYDYGQKQFFLFNDNKIQKIGKTGSGPGEYAFVIPSTITIDQYENLLFFNPANQSVFQYFSPNYDSCRYIFLNKYSGDLKVFNGKIYSYSTYDSQVLTIFDEFGNEIKKFHNFGEESLRLFVSRFNNGGICFLNGTLWLCYTNEYTLFQYDTLGNEIKKISFENSEFTPSISSFPKDLSPYEMTEDGWKYWDDILHTVGVYNLGSNKILVLLEKTKKTKVLSHYINLHSNDGSMLDIGIQIPTGCLFAGTNGDTLYTLHTDESNENYFKFYKYVLKQ